MPKKPALTKTLIGPSGEHFVLSRLYQQERWSLIVEEVREAG